MFAVFIYRPIWKILGESKSANYIYDGRETSTQGFKMVKCDLAAPIAFLQSELIRAVI